MVSSGSEGWRAKGVYDPTASIMPPIMNWMNSGTKGAMVYGVQAIVRLLHIIYDEVSGPVQQSYLVHPNGDPILTHKLKKNDHFPFKSIHAGYNYIHLAIK